MDWAVPRTKVHIVFDGPPGPTAGRFIETELPDGKGIGLGEWVVRENGHWALVIEVPTDTIRMSMVPDPGMTLKD
jgi:hypothetical protein